MNYILPSLFALIIVWSCTSKSQQSDNSISPTGADTLSFAIPTVTETRKDELPKRDEGSVEPVTADSSAYIGELYAFPATGDYYIYLPFPGDFQQLSRMTDSLVYEDDEIRRRRIPESAANRYFNLVGLETISVYTRAGYAGDARFVRVEQSATSS